MRKIFFAAIAVLIASAPLQAMTSADRVTRQAIIDVPVEPVDSITTFGRIQSWRALDRDTLIIWTTGLRPYLVELRWPSTDLRFANAIGVTGTNGRVHSRFDSIVVRGFRYPIEQIYRLTPTDARSLKAI